MKGKRPNLKVINEQVRSWFMTINAHEENGLPTISADQIEAAFRDIDAGSDWVFQLERGKGEQGYLHFQATLLLTRDHPRRRREVVKVLKAHGIPDAHLEKVRRVGAAAAYCSKSETRQAGPWWSSANFQESSARKARANGSGAVGDRLLLAEAVDDGMTPEQVALDDRLRLLLTPSNRSFVQTIWAARQSKKWRTEQRDVEVVFIWGATGVGKTRYVYDSISPDDLYVADLASRDPFGMYSFQPTVLFDEFRDTCSLSYLLRLLDRYPVQLDRRYENLWAAWTQVFIISNWPPQALYKGAPATDRAALERRITSTIHMEGDKK